MILNRIFLLLLFFSLASFARDYQALHVNVGAEIETIDPQKTSGVAAWAIIDATFSGLFRYNYITNKPEKDLVTKIKKINTTTWILSLRQDVFWVSWKNNTWVKERVVTASDVVFSFRRLVLPSTGSASAPMAYILKNAEKINKGKIKDFSKLGIRALNPSTLKIELEGPNPYVEYYLAHEGLKILPPEMIKSYGDLWCRVENLWMTGHFLIKDWKLKDRIITFKNPFHPEPAHLAEVDFYFLGIASPEATRSFRVGEIDIDLTGASPADLEDFRKKKLIKTSPKLGIYYLKLNQNRLPLNDVRVRQALNLALPREDIVKYLGVPQIQPAYSFVPTFFEGFSVPFVEPYSKRIQQAQAALKEAGFPGGKNFPKITYLYNTSETHQKIATIISKAWKKYLGLKVELLQAESKMVLVADRKADFDIIRYAWLADIPDPLDFLIAFESTSEYNHTGFADSQYDQWLRLARKTDQKEKRAGWLQLAQKKLLQESPFLPVYFMSSVKLVQKNVRNFFATPSDRYSFFQVTFDLK